MVIKGFKCIDSKNYYSRNFKNEFMEKLLFVGERRSECARQNGWHWEDGRLAAKQLFDALSEIGINPSECKFQNLLEGSGRSTVVKYAVGGAKIIALGRKVDSKLTKLGIPHVYMVHPAARGEIRKKQRYTEHVKQVSIAAGLLRQ